MIKTVLLTGATGFIGSHVLEELVGNNYRTIVLKRSDSDVWRIKNFLNKVICYDIDKTKLERPFSENEIDCVIHLATRYIKNHKGIDDASLMIDSNINFPTRIVELCAKYKVNKFINSGTFFEYKTKKSLIIDGDKIEPCNFYAATKVAFNDILKYYSIKNNLTVIDLKLFAPFGEKDNEKVIVFLIKALLENKLVEFSGGEQRWNFTYVKDIARAYLNALEKISDLSGFNSFNIGYEKAYNIKEAVEMIEKISSRKMNVRWGAKPYVENEIFYTCCDNNKAKDVLRWLPKYNIYSGLEKTYLYYKKPFDS